EDRRATRRDHLRRVASRGGIHVPVHPRGGGRSSMNKDGDDDMSIHVLLVEDSPGDVRLTREALGGANPNIHLSVVADGEEAMSFLKREEPHGAASRPDL